jgi:hypothetical protein
VHGWVERALGETDEEAAGVELVRCFDCRRGKGYDYPEEFPGGAPEGEADLSIDLLLVGEI